MVKLRNKYLQHPDRYARGKFYDTLDAPPVIAAIPKNESLAMHAICSLIPKGPKVPHHIDVRPMTDGSAWWVLTNGFRQSTLLSTH